MPTFPCAVYHKSKSVFNFYCSGGTAAVTKKDNMRQNGPCMKKHSAMTSTDPCSRVASCHQQLIWMPWLLQERSNIPKFILCGKEELWKEVFQSLPILPGKDPAHEATKPH